MILKYFSVGSFYAINTRTDATIEQFVEWAYLVEVIHLTYFTFQVKSCQDVEIGLLSNGQRANTLLYLIHIRTGKGSISDIIQYTDGNPTLVAKARTPDILNCVIYRELWLSWKAHSLRVGYGYKSFENEIMRTVSDNPLLLQMPIHSLGFRKNGGNGSAEWQFSSLEGKKFRLFSYEIFHFNVLAFVLCNLTS